MTKTTWEILYTESAKKEIRDLDKSISRFIKKAIEEKLMIDPLKYGKPLRQTLAGLYKLRVGDYRIIYQIERDKIVVLVVAVGHRSHIYK